MCGPGVTQREGGTGAWLGAQVRQTQQAVASEARALLNLPRVMGAAAA